MRPWGASAAAPAIMGCNGRLRQACATGGGQQHQPAAGVEAVASRPRLPAWVVRRAIRQADRPWLCAQVSKTNEVAKSLLVTGFGYEVRAGGGRG